MRQTRQSGSEGGVRLYPSSLPYPELDAPLVMPQLTMATGTERPSPALTDYGRTQFALPFSAGTE
jgi:hypothetical protein